MRLDLLSIETVFNPETVVSGIPFTGCLSVLIQLVVVILFRQLVNVWQDVFLVVLVNLEL